MFLGSCTVFTATALTVRHVNSINGRTACDRGRFSEHFMLILINHWNDSPAIILPAIRSIADFLSEPAELHAVNAGFAFWLLGIRMSCVSCVTCVSSHYSVSKQELCSFIAVVNVCQSVARKERIKDKRLASARDHSFEDFSLHASFSISAFLAVDSTDASTVVALASCTL